MSGEEGRALVSVLTVPLALALPLRWLSMEGETARMWETGTGGATTDMLGLLGRVRVLEDVCVRAQGGVTSRWLYERERVHTDA